jgi:ABC-type phosphate transport system substrate-binding protein
MKRVRRVLVLATLLTSLATTIPGRAADGVDRFIQSSRFCDSQTSFRPGPATIDGPASQLAVHTEVFEPAYAAACRLGSGLVTYLGTGDQAGINAVLDRRAERAFGTSDIPLSPVEYMQAWLDLRAPDRRGRTVQINQIPLFVTVNSVAFNLSCKITRLNLRSAVLSAIYSGTVTKWNDRLLTLDNPELATCAYPIRVVKRADFAGSSFTFKDYLSKRNPQWDYYKQPGQNQTWPTVTNACPALDEDGMAECIATTQNSIGYLQYHVAKLAHLRTAYLDSITSQAQPDPKLTFIGPSPQGCTTAAASALVPPPLKSTTIPIGTVTKYETTSFSYTRGDWSTISLTDAPQGYPLCSFGYAMVYQSYQIAYFGQQFTAHMARTAIDYLWTAIGASVQGRLPAFDYGSLPPSVVEVSRQGISDLRYANA